MQGRLSILQAAWVICRRDFTAILFSRSFVFFLLGPLFPVIVGVMAGGVGQRVQQSADVPALGVMMDKADAVQMEAAARTLHQRVGLDLPELRVIGTEGSLTKADPEQELAKGRVIAVLSGTPAAPVLTGPEEWIRRWQGPVSLMSAQAAGDGPRAYPEVALAPVIAPDAADRRGRLMTAQGAQTLLFLLTMLLAGMVLSNLVEEKGNKIIEILAAAIPMDAVFFGKLFAMLGVSFVGIAVWGTVGASVWMAAGSAVPHLTTPAVGWPLFVALGVIYFAFAYLLLGSVFLAIGSLASTVREVQTISMPVTMMQLVVFFLASYAMTAQGSPVEIAALLIPFSSPFTMLARAAQDGSLSPHVFAICWQTIWVLLLVRGGASLFRKRVMKSGPARQKKTRRWFGRKAPAMVPAPAN